MKYVYGVDVGGMSVKIGFFTESLKLIEKFSFATDPHKGKEILPKTAKAIQKNNQKYNIDMSSIIGVGFGIPGTVKNNYFAANANINWENVQLDKDFRNYLLGNYKIVGYNDANAAALGEYSTVSNDYQNMLFVTLGTGVGGGIIINGHLVEGAHGAAGEIGHMHYDNKYNFTCGCGKKGCFETICSASGLVRLTKYHAEKKALDVGDLSAKDIVSKAKNGEPFFLDVFDEYCFHLGNALKDICLVINPEIIKIGGGLSNSGEFLLEKVRIAFKDSLAKSLASLKNTKIVRASLGNDAGLYGAAFGALRK